MENNNTKNMKKFRKPLVIVAMVLMVALVCGMGAMTYSKYISTTDVPAQTATAAKWGFVVTANADNLFGDQYKTANAAPAYATVDGTGTVVVNANPDANIVAPGTTGYLLIQVSGMAEVRAQLIATLNVTETISDGETYKPIEWTLVNGDTEPSNSAVWTNDPSTLMNSVNAVLEPGVSANSNYRLYWRWNFSSNAENDKKDTVIGAKVAGKSFSEVNEMTGLTLTAEDYAKYTTTLTFSVTITIEQIQATP